MKRLKYWFLFSKRVYVSLSLGWLAVCISAIGVTQYLSLAQGGALLICAVIVAEILNDKKHRLFVNSNLSPTHIYREILNDVHVEVEVIPQKPSYSKITSRTTSWALYHLANNNEFIAEGDARLWDLNRTMKRVETNVDYTMAEYSGPLLKPLPILLENSVCACFKPREVRSS